ncbi:unnamed protein product [Caenorhabditis bovis]|uniref:EB domain-containing protein n=1 Tax=Caenorhabditis bovis TaxID=2654633 RepID=A0A8S1F3D2_9PELO|nr:unnamed protein product [Caenorhabditis bovis]
MIIRNLLSLVILYTTSVHSQLFTPCNGKSALDGVCDNNSDCDNKGSICLRGKCRCHPHYIETRDEKGRQKKLPAKVGARCSTKCREPLFCRNGECQCVQRGTTRISNGECVTTSRVGDRCSRHYDCTSPFSACLNSQCVCISGTIQQGTRCVAAANCPLGGLPGQSCVRRSDASLAYNLPPDQDNCPGGQVCVTAGDSPIGHCCPVVCPLASHVDHKYSCHPNVTEALKCPSDTHFCHLLSDGSFSQAVCCRRPCNALAPNALYTNNQCIPRGQLNSACTSNAQCGGGEGMECVKGQCQCQKNFHPSVDALTHPLKNPSQTCSRDCESENLSRDTSCMKSVPLGSLCFIQKQCPQNSGCYRGRCMCRCGFVAKNGKCAALPAPSTTTSAPSPPIIPGVQLPQGNDLFKLFGQFLGGGNSGGEFLYFIVFVVAAIKVIKNKPTTTTTSKPTTTTIPKKTSNVVCLADRNASECANFCEKLDEFQNRDEIEQSFTIIEYSLIGLIGALLIILIALIVFWWRIEPSEVTVREANPKYDDNRSTRPRADQNDSEAQRLLENPEFMAKFNAFKIAKEKEYQEDLKIFEAARKGKIYIPNEVEDADMISNVAANDDVKLRYVYYDPTMNGEYEIGTDIDEVELAPSTIVAPLTESARTIHRAAKNDSNEKSS